MEEYYFLFFIGLVWSLFAVVEDFKKREVSNWLNFSLVSFSLVYRAFYSIYQRDFSFFLSGLAGFFSFFLLAHLFYYSRVFAGGDAKLLMGFGVILPYSDISGFIYLSIIFFFLFFSIGIIYSLIYSLFIVNKNWTKFRKYFFNKIKKVKYIFFVLIIFLIISLFLNNPEIMAVILFFSFFFFLFIYVKCLDKCLLIKKSYKKLQEGDWIESDIKLKNNIIKKTVHGLTSEDIKLLKKLKKDIVIKDGIPFTPSFLFSLLIMAPFFLTLSPFDFFSFLF